MARPHPNLLKLRKQKRQGRRSYLTREYSLIKVPRRIGKDHIPEDAQALFDYRKRGTTTGYDPFLDAIFPGVTPKASEWKSEHLTKFIDAEGKRIAERAGEPNGRKFALERSEEEKLVALIEDPDVCEYITLKEYRLQKKRLTFVYNRKQSRCFFIEVHYLEGASHAMKSKVYGSRERAIFDYEHSRISWHDFVPLASLSLVLPRRG